MLIDSEKLELIIGMLKTFAADQLELSPSERGEYSVSQIVQIIEGLDCEET